MANSFRYQALPKPNPNVKISLDYLRHGDFTIHNPDRIALILIQSRIFGDALRAIKNRMRTFHFHWLLAILLPALTSPAGAAIQPAFSLDFSSFHATDVVVVQTMLDEDSFEVVEAWKELKRR